MNNPIRTMRKCFWKWWFIIKRGEYPRFGRCRYCKQLCLLVYTHSMTQYCEEVGKPDPNHVGHLCRSCRAEYQAYWQSMWDELYQDQMAGVRDAMRNWN